MRARTLAAIAGVGGIAMGAALLLGELVAARKRGSEAGAVASLRTLTSAGGLFPSWAPVTR